MKEFYYKNSKIVQFTKRNYLVLFMRSEGVSDHIPCRSLDAAKEIIDENTSFACI